MNIAYVRVSTQEQNTGRQLEALIQYNIERTFEEKISGKDTNRPQLKAMMEFAREGDVVYIESISRLARSTRDFLNIVDEMTAKNISLVSLKEHIDTTTPQGKFMLSVFAALSELERETIKQKQAEGIALNRAQNKPYGRPRIEIDEVFETTYKRWKAEEITAVEAMKLTGLKKNTFYNRVKDYEQEGR